MRISAQEIINAGWVDMDCGAPYHIETHPIGHDRKVHEGPFETNEDFPNTWMPTKEKIKPPCGCDQQLQKEDIALEEISIHVHGEAEAMPGVPMSLFKAWDAAHRSTNNFDSEKTVEALYRMADDIANFVEAAYAFGVRRMYDPEKIRRYAKDHPPEGGEKYMPGEVSDHSFHLDQITNAVHSDVKEATLTDSDQWYELQDNMRFRELRPKVLTDEEYERERQQKELREFRGPAAPFLEEMWERRKRHGERITAAEVLRFDPSRRRLKQAPPSPKKQPFSETLKSEMPFGPDIPVETSPYEDITEYDEILYLYDGLSTMLNDYIDPMVKAMQEFSPKQRAQVGKLIRNIQRAVQVLGQ